LEDPKIMKHWSFCWETMRNLYMVWGVPIWEIAIVRWSMCLQKPGSVFSIHLAPNPRRPRQLMLAILDELPIPQTNCVVNVLSVEVGWTGKHI